MKGKRIATRRRPVRHSPRKQPARHNGAAKNDRGLQLIFIVFVVLLALKLILPQQFDAFGQSASQIIGKNTDFAEAFAAVGRAVSGEDDVSESLQDAFLAVFNPSKIESENTQIDNDAQSLSASADVITDASSQEREQEELTLVGGYSMSSLPENASLELRNLGFSCTTPVNGTLSSAFGWREHPTQGGTKFHYGIDLVAEPGSDIVAFADGEVFAVGESSTLGKYIILVHPGGYKTLYAHCSEVTRKSGSVNMGGVIARVGASGSTTGAHLHFELQEGSLYLNPIYYVSIW